jgi:hypothetical protein
MWKVVILCHWILSYAYPAKYNLYFSPNIIRIIKSWKMRWVGHVARMGRSGMRIGFWLEGQKERDH